MSFLFKKKRALIPRHLPDEPTLGVFFPSEPVVRDRVERLNENMRSLASKGIVLKLGKNHSEEYYHSSAPAPERARELSTLLSNDDTDGLIAAWGGKTCVNILSELNFDDFSTYPKPIFGFSDTTPLLNSIWSQVGLTTFYGPNIAGKLDESEHSDFASVMRGGLKKGDKIDLSSAQFQPIQSGSADGVLIGGNLSSFVISTLGSRYFSVDSDVILLLESGGKKPLEFDMLFSAIRNSQIWPHVRGILIGESPLKEDSRWKNKPLSETVSEALPGFDGPIIYSPMFGHSKLRNPIFPIGTRVRLNTSDQEFTLLESAVA